MYKRPLFQLTRKTCTQRAAFVRFNSSFNNNKLELGTTDNTATATKKDKDDKPKNDFKKIPFMPVINIPETEFAHNAFFSLYRPLLGLSDKDEKPFFSNKSGLTQEELEEQKLDQMLANYMKDLEPFTEPSPPGNEPTLKEHEEAYEPIATTLTTNPDEYEVSLKVTEEVEYMENQQEPLDHYHDKSMAVFHMPESSDVIDFLSTVEQKMKNEHAKLDAEESSRASRLKKLEMIDNLKRSTTRPRFYTATNRNIHQRLRRYQKK